MGGRLDFSGCETTIAAEALPAWNDTMRAFLAHAASTPDHLGKVFAADPAFAQAHAVKGLFCLLLGRKEMVETARQCMAEARSCALKSAPNGREQAYIDALRDYLAGSVSAAAARFEALLVTHPRDALAMKMVQAIRFVLGQPQSMRASIEMIRPTPCAGYTT